MMRATIPAYFRCLRITLIFAVPPHIVLSFIYYLDGEGRMTSQASTWLIPQAKEQVWVMPIPKNDHSNYSCGNQRNDQQLSL